MTDTTIGYAVLQIIPSLKGVSEAIEKQIAGQVIPVTIEPKFPDKGSADRKKLDKAIRDEVKKAPVEVPVEPKIDAGKVGKQIDDAVKKAGQEAKSQKIELPPIDQAKVREQAKKAGTTISDAIKDAKNTKLELPQFDPAQLRGLGTKLRDAAMSGLRELQNPALDPIKEQVGAAIGQAIGERIGQAIANSPIGQGIQSAVAKAQPAIEAVKDVVGSLQTIKQGDAAGGLNGIAEALGKIGQTGAATQLHDIANQVQPLQDQFGTLKTNIEGTANNLRGLTNNKGKIAGGLSDIAAAAGLLAAVFVTLDKVMPGFDNALNHLTSAHYDASLKDLFNVLVPFTNILDKLGEKLGGLHFPDLGGPTGKPTPQAPGDAYQYGPGGAPPPPKPPGAPPGPAPGSPAWIYTHGGHAGGGLAGFGGGGIADVLNGVIRGPGTGKSDSILGWPAMVRVSNGEFLTNEEGTRRNLPLLRAVNAGVPLWDWMKSMPGFDSGGLVAGSQQLRKIISERFGIADIGGWRPADKYGEHSTGRALDVMVGNDKAKGDAVKDFALANASAIDLKWAIWQQRMWYPGGRSEPMEDRGSPTQNHMDHVHIFSGPGIINGLLGALQGKGSATPVSAPGRGDDAATPAGLKDVGGAPGAAPAPAAAGPGGLGGVSVPSSFTGLSSWGFDTLVAGADSKPGQRDPMAYFGKAAGAAVSGQVSSALGAFGVPDSPGWLQGISKLVGGISVGGPGSGGLGGGGATPASLRTTAAALAPATASTVTPGLTQQPGPRTAYYIQTARVEDAFVEAQRREREKAAAISERWT